MGIQWSTIIQHKVEDGVYEIKIRIPDGIVPYDALKTKFLSGRSPRLAVLDYARELVEKEAIWHNCPDWPLDYGLDN